MTSEDKKGCLLCRSLELYEIESYRCLPRVTSDSKPFKEGGQLFICQSCGLIQKNVSKTWLEEISSIYADYYSYHQAEGEEQVVFDQKNGGIRRRSDLILDQVAKKIDISNKITWLDIGCGTGNTLKAVSLRFPQMFLYGHEIDHRFEERFASLSSFKKLYTSELSKIDEKFDVISLIHVLEHFIDPLKILGVIKDLLSRSGLLLIEVCDVDLNPVDLLVADHLIHFTKCSLENFVKRAGFSVKFIESGLVPKELTAVFKLSKTDEIFFDVDDIALMTKKVEESVKWLNNLVYSAKYCLSNNKKVGIFGTSLAATWLSSQLNNKVAFYVDEDTSRQGRNFQGKPVISPENIPTNSTVFLCLTPLIAEQIFKRLASNRYKLVMPNKFIEAKNDK